MLNAITTRYGRRVGASVILTLAVTLGFVALFAGHVATVGTPAAATAALTSVGVVVTLNLGLLGIVLVGNVAVELRRLTETAEAVGRGEFDARATSDRRDEIGRLFAAFDETRRSLRDAVAESERAQSEAEAAREEAESMSETLLERADEIGGAMEDAADGDLTHRLDEESDVDAIERITAAYNEMTGGLSTTVE
ncbi:HAMP domain-containing protein, partial [Haloarcula sp. AONF1]